MGFWDDMKTRAGELSDGLKTRVDQYKNADFAAAAMATCAMVAAADGTIDASERRKTAAFIASCELLKSFDVAELQAKFNFYCDKLQADYDFGKIEAIQVVGKLKKKPDQARAVLQVGIVIGGSDGKFDDNEKAAVRELCYAVAIDPAELGV
jgi:tellurite resistance protein TerB